MRCCLVHERLLVSSRWPFAKSPSSRQRENKTDPFSPRLVFRLLWSFHGISKIGKEEEEKKRKNPGSICRKTPPSPLVALLTSRCVLRAWSRIFQLTASPSIYTLSSCIPFVKIISWSRHTCSCDVAGTVQLSAIGTCPAVHETQVCLFLILGLIIL